MPQMWLGKRNEIQQYDCSNRANVVLVVVLSPFMLALKDIPEYGIPGIPEMPVYALFLH